MKRKLSILHFLEGIDKLYNYVYTNSMDEITLTKLKCLRCGYTWFPRKPEPPQACANPKCRSPYWNKPRKNKRKGVKSEQGAGN